MWRGTMWDDYEFGDEDEVFDGWDRTLEGITFTSLQQATPDPDLKSRWLAGQANWDEILESYKENLEDREQLQITYS